MHAWLLERAGPGADAAAAYERAAALAKTAAERDLLEQRIASLSA